MHVYISITDPVFGKIAVRHMKTSLSILKGKKLHTIDKQTA
jgi:hypothetical protein